MQSRMIRDVFWLCVCWGCWLAYTRGPWAIMRTKFGTALLPYAGMYAFSPTWAHFQECCPPGRAALAKEGK